MEMKPPVFFSSQNDLHKRFQKNYSKDGDLWIGFYSVKSQKKGVTYKQALDEALCFGWIDGIRKNVDNESYAIRFTSRKKKSIWSNVNTNRMNELIKEGKVQRSGLASFKERLQERSGIYSFEQDRHKLSPAFLKTFKVNKKAWQYFSSKALWYQRTAIHWVMSARQEATRLKRLQILVNDSENQTTIKVLTRTPKK